MTTGVMQNNVTVLSIGGSLLVPNGGPSVEFLGQLRSMVLAEVERGMKFVLVTGGGKTARHYIDAASKVMPIAPDDLDWLGIHATRLNGHLLRTVLRDVADPIVYKNPLVVPRVHAWRGSVIIAAGWKPGWSTDYVACRIAKRLGATSIVNVSNIDYVYSDDPRTNPGAQAFEALSWRAYRKMVGDAWDPGLSAPFDPIASRFCHKHNLSVAIVNGANTENVRKAARGEPFVGTKLS